MSVEAGYGFCGTEWIDIKRKTFCACHLCWNLIKPEKTPESFGPVKHNPVLIVTMLPSLVCPAEGEVSPEAAQHRDSEEMRLLSALGGQWCGIEKEHLLSQKQSQVLSSTQDEVILTVPSSSLLLAWSHYAHSHHSSSDLFCDFLKYCEEQISC